jgi:hypothetical protein
VGDADLYICHPDEPYFTFRHGSPQQLMSELSSATVPHLAQEVISVTIDTSFL